MGNNPVNGVDPAGDQWISDYYQGWGTQTLDPNATYNSTGQYGKGFIPYGKNNPHFTIYRYMGRIKK